MYTVTRTAERQFTEDDSEFSNTCESPSQVLRVHIGALIVDSILYEREIYQNRLYQKVRRRIPHTDSEVC